MTEARRSAPAEAKLSEPVMIALSDIVEDYSPRAVRLDNDHVQVLSEVIDRLPPVIVQEGTLRLLDGLHRVEAFRRADRPQIAAALFSGSEDEAVALAIHANIRHGRALTQAERRAGVSELLARFPGNSDRWIADACGVSHTTVANTRRFASEDQGVRIGRDGRTRRIPSRKPAGASEPSDHESTSSETDRPSGPRTGSELSGQPHPDNSPPDALAELSGPVLDWLSRTAVTDDDLNLLPSDLTGDQIKMLARICRDRSRIWAALGGAWGESSNPEVMEYVPNDDRDQHNEVGRSIHKAFSGTQFRCPTNIHRMSLKDFSDI